MEEEALSRLGIVLPSGEGWAARRRRYRVEGEGPLTHLRVRGSGGFGNQLAQLANAVALAAATGVAEVWHDVPWMGEGGEAPALRHLGRGARAGMGVAGRFAVRDNLGPIARLSARRRRDLVVARLRPRFALAPAGPPGPPVLSVRGGADLFEDPAPHPHYGQPPLAFYTEAVRRARFDEVLVVAQDRRNPVADALEVWLAETPGLRGRVVSEGAEGDARHILAAGHLVWGTSTFVEALALLGGRARTGHYMRAMAFAGELVHAVPRLRRFVPR
ncbi:MAG: hypothetical protein AAFW69_12850, partial [Pseudomonadota bacterium]